SLRARAYETRATYTVGKTRAVYTRKDIDFLIGHVIPLDVWYIIPVEVCTPAPMLRFYPHRKAKKMRLEKYRGAWHLLQPKNKNPRNNGPITLHASIDASCWSGDLHGHCSGPETSPLLTGLRMDIAQFLDGSWPSLSCYP